MRPRCGREELTQASPALRPTPQPVAGGPPRLRMGLLGSLGKTAAPHPRHHCLPDEQGSVQPSLYPVRTHALAHTHERRPACPVARLWEHGPPRRKLCPLTSAPPGSLPLFLFSFPMQTALHSGTWGTFKIFSLSKPGV